MMKITLNKSAITLAEHHDALTLAQDWGESINENFLEAVANNTLKSNALRSYGSISDYAKLVKVNGLEVTKNRDVLTIWADVVLQNWDNFYIVGFDLLQANKGEYEDHIDNYTQVFRRVEE